MKRVSFKIAKALKEAGYPQDYLNSPIYTQKGEFHNFSNGCYNYDDSPLINAPYVMEVWLWLWREKGFRFELSHPEYNGEYDFDKLYCNVTSGRGITDNYSDPEEAIESAINYLVERNLIK